MDCQVCGSKDSVFQGGRTQTRISLGTTKDIPLMASVCMECGDVGFCVMDIEQVKPYGNLESFKAVDGPGMDKQNFPKPKKYGGDK